jgi:hypothetical protein
MWYLHYVCRVTLFRKLQVIDLELASLHSAERCQVEGCGGPLHRADYERKPRGLPTGIEVPEECCRRVSFCCGWCRRRSLPRSCLFFGRRVYFSAVVLLVTAAWQGRGKRSMTKLCQRFKVDARTVKRWLNYFEAVFPVSRLWQRVRGLVSAEVRSFELPYSLVRWYERQSRKLTQLVCCLRLLASRPFELCGVQAN